MPQQNHTVLSKKQRLETNHTMQSSKLRKISHVPLSQEPEEDDQDGFGGGVLRKRQKLSASGEVIDEGEEEEAEAEDDGVVKKKKKSKKGAKSKAVAGADVSTVRRVSGYCFEALYAPFFVASFHTLLHSLLV